MIKQKWFNMLSKFEGKLRKQGIVKDKHGWKR